MRKRLTILIAPCVIMMAAVLSLAFFGSSYGGSPVQLTATFQKYEEGDTYKVGEHDTSHFARLWLTNASKKTFYLIDGGLTDEFYVCEFRSQTSDGFTNWVPRVPKTNGIITVLLKPHSSMSVQVPVPNEQGSSQVALICLEARANLAEPWKSLRQRWWAIVPPKPHKKVKVWCDRDLSYVEAAKSKAK